MFKKNHLYLRITCIAVVLCAIIFVAPKLILVVNGSSEMIVECGEKFEDPGAGLRINIGQIKTEGTVDSSTVGEYHITYSFFTAKAVRTVSVVDTTPPEISLLGASGVFVEKGNVYVEAGAEAFDSVDGNLTSEIWTEGTIDENTPGEYHISYYAKDKSGNVARERRKITVTEGGPWSQDVESFDLNPYYPDVICKETEYDEEKFNKIYFIGDSFVGKLIDNKLAQLDHMWDASNMNTDMLLYQKLNIGTILDRDPASPYNAFEAIDLYKPEVVIFIVGNSYLPYWTPEYFQISADKAYGTFAQTYPDIQFVLCSFPPAGADVERGYLSSAGFSKNDRSNKYNVILCDIARKYGMKFLNAAEALKNPEDNCIFDDCLQGDRFHLNLKGNEILIDYIKHHMDW